VRASGRCSARGSAGGLAATGDEIRGRMLTKSPQLGTRPVSTEFLPATSPVDTSRVAADGAALTWQRASPSSAQCSARWATCEIARFVTVITAGWYELRRVLINLILQARLAKCPLHSETDRIAALPRIDAISGLMHTPGIGEGRAATTSHPTIWDYHRHTDLVRVASSLPPDMIFGKDRGPNSRGRFSGERVASMSAATCGIGGATKPGCRFAHPGCASFVFDLQMCNRHDLKSCGATLFAAACLRERAHIRKNAA